MGIRGSLDWGLLRRAAARGGPGEAVVGVVEAIVGGVRRARGRDKVRLDVGDAPSGMAFGGMAMCAVASRGSQFWARWPCRWTVDVVMLTDGHWRIRKLGACENKLFGKLETVGPSCRQDPSPWGSPAGWSVRCLPAGPHTSLPTMEVVMLLQGPQLVCGQTCGCTIDDARPGIPQNCLDHNTPARHRNRPHLQNTGA